jgi:hypothetical protein
LKVKGEWGSRGATALRGLFLELFLAQWCWKIQWKCPLCFLLRISQILLHFSAPPKIKAVPAIKKKNKKRKRKKKEKIDLVFRTIDWRPMF